MIPCSSRTRFGLLPVVVLVAIVGNPVRVPAQAPVWVSKLKSAPQDYRDRAFVVRGDAVEVRGATPFSTHGIYRLVDASDPSGVLIRSTELPTHSGPYQVQARLSPELLSGGSLVLDEVGRSSPFRLMRFLPKAVALAGGFGALLFLALFIQAKRAERRHDLGPPIWLMPTGPEPAFVSDEGVAGIGLEGVGGVGSGSLGRTPGAASTNPFSPRLRNVDEHQGRALALATRRISHGLVAAGAVAAAGAGWYFSTRSDTADRPMFALLSPEMAATPTPEDATAALEPAPAPTAGTDSLVLRVGGEQNPPPAEKTPAARREEPAPRNGSDRRTPPQSVTTPTRVDSQPARRNVAKVDTATARPAPRIIPLSPPPPPPPPPPATPAPRDTVASTPPPDPEAERRAASAILQQGAARLVSAIAQKQVNEVAALYPPDAAWRAGLLDHVRDYGPTATLGSVDQVVLTEAGAEVAFTVSFRWRGNFGVERRKDARFAATARRAGAGWTLVGVRLLQSFP